MTELNPPAPTAQIAAPALDISVVFATRDRAEQLEHTLAAYRALDTTGISWELVVIDNNSRDGTAVVLAAAAGPLPLTRLFVAAGGQNRARNVAIERLRGELVIFTDDDVLPEPNYLQAYTAAAARWPDEVIFGARIEPRFPDNTPAWLRSNNFAFATTAFARYHPAEHEGPVKRHPYGPSFAIRRHALTGRRFPEHLGPQSGAYPMGGEGYFLRDIAAQGYRYIHVPEARVEHIVRTEQITERWLLTRARHKGRGQVYLPSDKTARSVYIGRVPLRLYLAVLRSRIRYEFARLGASAERRIKLGIQYQSRRGQVEELRARGSIRADGPCLHTGKC